MCRREVLLMVLLRLQMIYQKAPVLVLMEGDLTHQ